MTTEQPLFPHVIELNHQARRRIGCSVYLIYDETEWTLIDIGYEDAVDECVELIRELDFPFQQVQDAHRVACRRRPHPGAGQGEADAQDDGHRPPVGGRTCWRTGDRLTTFAQIDAPGDRSRHAAGEGREPGRTTATSSRSASWNSKSGTRPGHTDGQLSSAWAICSSPATTSSATAASGRSTPTTAAASPDFIKSLQRITASDVEWLLPSHGPVFRKDNALIDKTIARLEGYLHMADFGTCAIDWPLMDEWERELVEGKQPG